MNDEQEFFAWLDGELDAAAAERVAAKVAADPALTEQARAHRALGAALRNAFAPAIDAPVPDRIGGTAIDFAAARERRQRPAIGRLPQWAAIAAMLILGIGIGTQVGGGRSVAPVTIEGGRMVAAAELRQALDHQLASAVQTGAGTRIELTFRTSDGALCRSFGSASAAGLACRVGGAWRIEGLYPASSGSAGDYRMAAGTDPHLTDMIDAMIAGDPLDAPAEREAQANGWR